MRLLTRGELEEMLEIVGNIHGNDIPAETTLKDLLETYPHAKSFHIEPFKDEILHEDRYQSGEDVVHKTYTSATEAVEDLTK